MSKKVCVITNYFPPETGAASNRIHHLAQGLSHIGFSVSVLAPLPNYPEGRIFKDYRGKIRHQSRRDGIDVERLWVFASNSKNKLQRLVAMLSYSCSLALFFLRKKLPETVIIQSPPLLVAFTCVFLLRSKKRQLILNVSDLWPIAGLELGALKKGFYYRILERIEHYNYKNVNLVLGQSQEILDHVKQCVTGQKTFLYRNYPVFKIPDTPERLENTGKLKVVYAGLLGVAQGILNLCEHLDYHQVEFHIYGSGAETTPIKNFIATNNMLPIRYHGSLKREELHKALVKYDMAIVPLSTRIYGSVPSKIFEFAKLGLPILYCGGGEGESIVKEHQLGWVVPPGDFERINEAMRTIESPTQQMRDSIKMKAEKHFNFEYQLQHLQQLIQ